ncbi:MAG: uracil-DNA glycosylase [Alphaproteobacteria bacterium CG_4_9_14_3_um_filter_47_13]|nr:MAG: uracil-DNA glycosylase [Alphaproteobacteria bacterium CG_4_9_14_3_um_filter_47_13]
MDFPSENCPLCPRLANFREQNRKAFPGKFNAPVPSFGSGDAEFLIVGLAPGLRGANFSGRPFTGDYAGDLLYATLLKYGFAQGVYDARNDDGFSLVNCRITNAVRCVPPENKPVMTEIRQCQNFLENELRFLPNLKIILALGKIAYDSVLRAHHQKISDFKFRHGGINNLQNGTILVASYHCSRYNTNTGRLTESMFHDVFDFIRSKIRL